MTETSRYWPRRDALCPTMNWQAGSLPQLLASGAATPLRLMEQIGAWEYATWRYRRVIALSAPRENHLCGSPVLRAILPENRLADEAPT